MKKKIFHVMTPVSKMEAYVTEQAKQGFVLVSAKKTVLDICYRMKFEKKEDTIKEIYCSLTELENELSWEYHEAPQETEVKNGEAGVMTFIKINLISNVVVMLLWLVMCVMICIKESDMATRCGLNFAISLVIFYIVLRALRNPIVMKNKTKKKKNIVPTLLFSAGAVVVLEIVTQCIHFLL